MPHRNNMRCCKCECKHYFCLIIRQFAGNSSGDVPLVALRYNAAPTAQPRKGGVPTPAGRTTLHRTIPCHLGAIAQTAHCDASIALI